MSDAPDEARVGRQGLLAGFDAYYRPTDDDWSRAFEDGRFVLDTNAILDAYRLSPPARSEYLEVLAALGDRLVIPHQVAREFHDNRTQAVAGRLDEFTTQETEVERHASALRKLAREIGSRSGRVAEAGTCEVLIEGAETAIRDLVEQTREEYDLDPDRLFTRDDDPVLRRLTRVFDDRVLAPPSDDQLLEDTREAQRRIDHKEPPGYADGGKSDNPHGDYLWWAEVVRLVQREPGPLVVITNDTNKRDWMRESRGMRIGLREELVREVAQFTNDLVLTRTTRELLSQASSFIDVTVSEKTVAEATALPTVGDGLESFIDPPGVVSSSLVHQIADVDPLKLERWVDLGLLPQDEAWAWADLRDAALLGLATENGLDLREAQRLIGALADRTPGRNVLLFFPGSHTWVPRRDEESEVAARDEPPLLVVRFRDLENGLRQRHGELMHRFADAEEAAGPPATPPGCVACGAEGEWAVDSKRRPVPGWYARCVDRPRHWYFPGRRLTDEELRAAGLA